MWKNCFSENFFCSSSANIFFSFSIHFLYSFVACNFFLTDAVVVEHFFYKLFHCPPPMRSTGPSLIVFSTVYRTCMKNIVLI